MSTTTRADCGCNGVTALTPVDERNPPGQSVLHYRVGTQARFFDTQLARLAAEPALHSLTTRDPGDPALALLDAWSCVLDVLSFYQERIVNEGFLRTATERRSVLELARAIGYELRPGVAASTFLAFTLETAPGAPEQARIDAGTKTQSQPAQDEQPQVFETLAPLQARARWNAIEAWSHEAVPPHWGGRTLYLQGQATRLVPGDALLVIGDERRLDPGNEHWDFRRVQRVQVVAPAQPGADPLAGTTVVTLDRPLGSVRPHVDPALLAPRCLALRSKAALFGQAAADWRTMPRSLRASYQGFDNDESARISVQRDWPDFTLAGVSDPPGTPGVGSGLYAEYFAGKSFNTLKRTGTDAQVNFGWGTGGPPGVPVDGFSARWTGWLQAPTTGDYVFHVTVDDGARLWVDQQLVVDSWVDQAPTEHSSAPLRLSAGRKVDIKLEYYENSGSATVQLRWSGPGLARQIVATPFLFPRDVHTVHLDASYPKILAGSWVVLSVPDYDEVYEVLEAREDARAAFALSGKSTRLVLRGEQLRERFDARLRETSLYGEPNELFWATRPRSGLVSGHVVRLAGLEPDLPAGRWLAFSGHRLADLSANQTVRRHLQAGRHLAAVELSRDELSATLTFTHGERWVAVLERVSEVVLLSGLVSATDHTELVLATDLLHSYLPWTLRINANVAPASHGDSKQMRSQPEVLGSGQGSARFQRFTLRQLPLTHVSAATASGTAAALELRVDGVAWHEAPRITALGPHDGAYLVRRADDGTVTLHFGDGEHGRRLPTGQMNLQARYRVGLGRAGNLPAGQISLLLDRALGVKAVQNPVAAQGGADPELLADARRNAPLTVLALDRIVSLQDFEDFAAAFAGVGKAQAVWLWDGQGRLVHLTVIGLNGASIEASSALYRNLLASIDTVRPAHQALRVEAGVLLRFGLSAGLRLLPDHDPAQVLPVVRDALARAFGFEARIWGQSLAGSEVLGVIQGVAGIERVDLDSLRLHTGTQLTTVAGPDGRLRARGARWEGNRIEPAQLLLIDPADVALTELS